MPALDGKVAIITGGTSGIGAACVERFAAAGAHVIIAARREDEGHELERALGDRVLFVQTDVSQEHQVRELVQVTTARHGRIDCLVNNAGHSLAVQSIRELQVDEFDRLVGVHLRGSFLCMKHVGNVMVEQGSGSIINVASISGQIAGISNHVYSAVKAALIQATRSVALELGVSGVRVNSVSPGAIVTGIFGKAAGMTESQAADTFDNLSSRFARFQSIPRAGRPVDIANAIAWLASDDAAFVNGTDIRVDGAVPGGLAWEQLNVLRSGLVQ
ncbi:MAG TPA: glucose 1-dehydrogenase [Kofleriaceae bacterium]